MLQYLTLIGLGIALWLPLMDYGFFRPRRKALADAPRFKFLERAVFFLFVGAVALMAISSFAMLAIGDRMHRWMLIMHMSVAPGFAVLLTALTYLWAEQSRFTGSDAGQRFYSGEKFAFWVSAVAGFLTISSAMLGMMTWFGSKGQDVLLMLHRVSALLLVISATYQATRLWVSRPAPSPGSQALDTVGASRNSQ